jgi:hypothetical protein
LFGVPSWRNASLVPVCQQFRRGVVAIDRSGKLLLNDPLMSASLTKLQFWNQTLTSALTSALIVGGDDFDLFFMMFRSYYLSVEDGDGTFLQMISHILTVRPSLPHNCLPYAATFSPSAKPSNALDDISPLSNESFLAP